MNEKHETIMITLIFIGVGLFSLATGYLMGHYDTKSKMNAEIDEIVYTMSDGYENVRKSLNTCSQMCPQYQWYVKTHRQ